MAISSIHFRHISSASESLNTRKSNLDYIHKDHSHKNESWVLCSIPEMKKHIESECKRISGRKLQKNAKPIREAVVNLNENHTMDDLKTLGNLMEKHFGIKCFQIYIHKDQGRQSINDNSFIPNHHAHMLFSWQNQALGVTLKHTKIQYSQMQTIVAESLKMERGKFYSNGGNKPQRLEAVEFKRKAAIKELNELKMQIFQLRQELNALEAIKKGGK